MPTNSQSQWIMTKHFFATANSAFAGAFVIWHIFQANTGSCLCIYILQIIPEKQIVWDISYRRANLSSSVRHKPGHYIKSCSAPWTTPESSRTAVPPLLRVNRFTVFCKSVGENWKATLRRSPNSKSYPTICNVLSRQENCKTSRKGDEVHKTKRSF